MSTKNILFISALGVALVAGAFYVGRQSGSRVPTQLAQQDVATTTVGESVPVAAPGSTSGIAKPSGVAGTSRVVFTLGDDAASLDSFQSILFTVNDASVYAPQKGWVSISKTPRQFDLLALYRNNSAQLFADVGLAPGTYTALRITVGKVVIVQKNGLPSIEARLPSQVLQFAMTLIVNKGQTSGATLDLNSTKSLYKTADGSYLFFPVVKVDTHHMLGTVQTLGTGTQLIGGYTDFSQTWGMDANGTLKVGFSYPSYLAMTQFALIGKVIYVIPINEKPSNIPFSAESAVTTAVQGKYFDTALSVQMISRQNKWVWQVTGVKGATLVSVYLDSTTGALIAVE